MKYILAFSLFIINVCFLQQKDAVGVRLVKIKSIIHSQPEEARKLIEEILSDKKRYHDTIIGDAYKCYGIYHNVKGNQDSSLYYHIKSSGFTKKYPKKNIQSLINLADTYRKRNDFLKAEALLNQAEKVSLENNNILLGRIYSAKGSVYNYMMKGEQAFTYLSKSVGLLKRDNDFEMLPFAQASLAGNYMYKENFSFAIDLYKEALEGFKKNNHLQNYYVTLINYADCHIHINQPEIAIKSLQESVTGFEKSGNEQLLVNGLWKLAKAQSLAKDFKTAITTYERAQKLAIKQKSERAVNITAEYIELLLNRVMYSNIPPVIERMEKSAARRYAFPEDKIFYEQQKALYYEKTLKSEEAVNALKEAFRMRDSLDNAIDNAEMRDMQAKYQNDLQREKNITLEKENQRLEENNAFKSKIYWLTFSLIVLALLAATIFIAFLKSKNKLQQESLKRIEASHQLVVQEHQNELQQNQLLQKDLELKNLALKNSQMQIDNFITDIEQKNELINRINNDLINLANTNAEEDIIKAHRAKLDTIVSKAIVTDDKWESFIKTFNEVYPGYLEKITLILPGLSPAETRYITLRKLKLSPRETATALGVQPDSIRLYKHRLRKKYNLTNDGQLDKILDQ